MEKLKTLKDLKLSKSETILKMGNKIVDRYGETTVKVKDLKQMAIEYQELRTATPKDNKITLYFHCKTCLEAGEPSQVDVGWSGSQSRFVVECKRCKKLVNVIDLAEAQADVVAHIFNLTKEDIK